MAKPLDNRIQQTKKALIEALYKSLGVVSAACKAVGVNRSTFYKYLNEDPEFKDEVDAVSEYAVDFAETSLFKQIQDGNTTATIFYLKTKGRARGYVERQEIDHTSAGEKIQFTGFNFLPDDATDDDERGEAAT